MKNLKPLTNKLISIGKEWKIESQIIAFGADNCPTNFGGITRRGELNELKLSLNGNQRFNH